MSKYVLAAQKLVQQAGVGGGMPVIQKYSKYLEQLAQKARDEGDEDSAEKVESLSEALITANAEG